MFKIKNDYPGNYDLIKNYGQKIPAQSHGQEWLRLRCCSYACYINCLILALSWLVFGRMHSFFSSSTWSFCTPSDPSFSGITFQKSNFLGFFGIWCMLMELMEDAWLFATEDVAVSDTLLFLESYFRICLNRFFIDSVQDPFKCK